MQEAIYRKGFREVNEKNAYMCDSRVKLLWKKKSHRIAREKATMLRN